MLASVLASTVGFAPFKRLFDTEVLTREIISYEIYEKMGVS